MRSVRCYVCPNPGSIERTCLPGNVSNIPTNEIIEECTNGCYEKFLRSHSNTTISRGCERHSGPFKCWDVDGCEDLATDKKHFCSCGTNLCNKNLACFKGERDPPTTSPSIGNPVVDIFSFFLIIIAITLI
ncbi:unnamed protein product [Orchesella dallaii]|uniref:Protein quiver n=1 Tax=Orchesella dallaii TaxID=48710 RepID=A0ABP1S1L7_9HEXA